MCLIPAPQASSLQWYVKVIDIHKFFLCEIPWPPGISVPFLCVPGTFAVRVTCPAAVGVEKVNAQNFALPLRYDC